MNDIAGVVNFYKDRGPTSFKATEKIKQMFRVNKAGHGGTLDPEAEGVLPVFLGNATRISALFLKAEKEYRVYFQFGLGTDTFDMAGRITEQLDAFALDRAAFIDALKSFEGSYMQRPPKYSALKVKGRRAYKLARKGVKFELKPRRVTCRNIECIHFDGREAEVFVTCEAGFYIRSMARDLSEKIGVPATVKKIIREKSGLLTVGSSLHLGELENMKKEGRLLDAVISIDDALPNLPAIRVDEQKERKVILGSSLEMIFPSGSPAGKYKIKNPKGEIIALVEKAQTGIFRYMCVFPKE